jgi:hypothetical protein
VFDGKTILITGEKNGLDVGLGQPLERKLALN